MKRDMIRGISVCNPVDIKKDYLLYTVDYAIKNGFDHMQFIGPIHNPVKGNIDGMTVYKKYSVFNDSEKLSYAENTISCVNEACRIAHDAGVKTYVWHHELEVPADFIEVYPEICNKNGDVEITHPIIKDFLENKISDFFEEYPLIDGIILTLHETRIPLLKLKNQKLDKKDRVKYVTKILYDACKERDKELIVRTFASIDEDYEMMLRAYEEISTELLVMDKWTQFDWSLCLPHNKFFKKVKKNPLFIETDIFGEFFGKGRLPLMLKKHIEEKFSYCEQFNPRGYVSRIDRGQQNPFGGVNEVNLVIMNACMNNKDTHTAILDFFEEQYPGVAEDIMDLMLPTEDILRKIIYLKGYYFSELSAFPSLNHCKNHFYFEMMRENYSIASDEWFIPKNWERGSIESVLKEKEEASLNAGQLLKKLESIKHKIPENKYENLWTKFANLKYTADAFRELTNCFLNYTRYFETEDCSYREMLLENVDKLREINEEGKEVLGKKFYCTQRDIYHDSDNSAELINQFADELISSLEAEEMARNALKAKNNVDFVVCGGALESHELKKEVNFSDTLMLDGELCRIPAAGKGESWSTVNTHGWFSYEIKVIPNCNNKILVTAGSSKDFLNLIVTVGEEEHIFREKINHKKTVEINYKENKGMENVRIRFDRNSAEIPYIFTVEVFGEE